MRHIDHDVELTGDETRRSSLGLRQPLQFAVFMLGIAGFGAVIFLLAALAAQHI
jgi:hypothetical protein